MPSKDFEALNHDVPFFILNERKVGLFQQTFTLPVDVDMKELKVKLEDGLLRVDLPRRDMSGEPKMKVELEWRNIAHACCDQAGDSKT
jgi:HSP20 family molecular chaperone IbpA